MGIDITLSVCHTGMDQHSIHGMLETRAEGDEYFRSLLEAFVTYDRWGKDRRNWVRRKWR